MAAVTVDSDSPDGRHYQITLDKTGAATANVDLTTWPQGQDPDSGPCYKHTYQVDQIRATPDGSRLVCQTHVLFFSPTINVTINGPAPPQQEAIVEIKIDSGQPSEYPVSAADGTKLRQYIVSCHFPAGA
jgi:hypothetical protein